MVWVKLLAVQLVMLVATVLGWLILIPFCLIQAWSREADDAAPSIKDNTRLVDRWNWEPLNYIYGNPEDGVSGRQAIVYTSGVAGPYMPNAWAPWRAYLWSGWRNSADNLKYVFACSSCPLKTGTFLGRPYKLGWQQENGYNVPVISWG
jgi:hypothetical protein